MSTFRAAGGFIGLLGLVALFGSATGAQAPAGKLPAARTATDSGVMQSGGCIWDNTLVDENLIAPFLCGSLFDDFTVGKGECTFSALWTLGAWNLSLPGRGTGADISIFSDKAGRPGSEILVVNVTNYSEGPTGRGWGARAEAEVNVTFDPITLPEGEYWIKIRIIGPDFWTFVTGCGEGAQGNIAWVDDCLVPGPRPISDLAYELCHAASDITWRLTD